MKSIDRKTLKELLSKCWMTHDAMWFFHCLNEVGIEKTNAINKLAIHSMGAIEIKRYQQALGIGAIETFETLTELIDGVFSIVKADFMDFVYRFPGENAMYMEMKRCFAYDGMKRIGAIDQYQCGIFHRVTVWLETLGIKYSVSPRVDGCMMHDQGKCYRDFKFYF